ncbi:uncharacterized protein LOC5572637 isoform X1 [Aedes aegypti]|uniref:RRM domain-containing protein n=1 Tax=Aedes aegypti TaxID=7159 RepID=A0A6I8U0R5_AEDAE|nr:uncharacterized protein LOC5572637 isoform X1 [Aedes aegypti]XP_021699079.1 uncharacterized protein LOC5572637 isoform X1 [Aedes aegypti]XP_021699080.1 uncharacterized protein LOC5572637 isoform X1 [Aedes aegypti]XP_021699081.1 uncharacterized protein LOC5572637 isoform X1 [Aedes aegypti]XP_021699082.1 uncharacterized protein LOC5572637 isoform X1 [Aedes aegypti]XP_021699083.1 uncharacterized protein LOC5572637 isoform X1 [Aedes aegypti]
MKMSKLSNQTNSQDPQAVNSRVFVGNLNTFQCSKTDVERMFQRYGRLAGISMHKGYAFVQFTNPFDARNACHGEDGRTVLSQTLDVNMVAEPKPHQTGRKRQNKSKTGNDWDYYYDSYYASTLFGPIQQQPSSQPRPMKRQRLMPPSRLPLTSKMNGAGILAGGPQVPQQQSQHPTQQQLQLAAVAATSPSAAAAVAAGLGSYYGNGNGSLVVNGLSNGCLTSNGYINNNSYLLNGDVNGSMSSYTNGQHVVGPFKVYSNPDTLICGNCREMFTDLTELLDHKKSYCKLRFTCKCVSPLTVNKNKSNPPSAKLLCVACKDSFSNPWDLMVHAQAAHMVNIYELGDSSDEDKASSMSSDSLADSSVNESSSTKRLTNGSDKSGETNGTHHEDARNHHVNGKSSEQNENTDNASNSNGLKGASSTEDIHTVENGSESAKVNDHSTLPYNGASSSIASPHQVNNSEDLQPTRACIMTALSINTKSNPDATVALKMVTSSLGISLTNGTTVTAATQ